MKKLYASSKLKHRNRWLPRNKYISSWLDHGKISGATELGLMWEKYFSEIEGCWAFSMYVGKGEVLKGALVEAGAALANKKIIKIIKQKGLTDDDLEKICGTWIHHRNVVITEEEVVQ